MSLTFPAGKNMSYFKQLHNDERYQQFSHVLHQRYTTYDARLNLFFKHILDL